ncbi:MAG: hypothetical protein ACJAUH_001477 [Saprospiraceae bacterium]|jgi:hypothetical protein
MKERLFIITAILLLYSCEVATIDVEGTWSIDYDKHKNLSYPFNAMFLWKSDYTPYPEVLYFSDTSVEYSLGFGGFGDIDDPISENFISYHIDNDTISFLRRDSLTVFPIRLEDKQLCIGEMPCFAKCSNSKEKIISHINYEIWTPDELSLVLDFDLVENIYHLNFSILKDSVSVPLETYQAKYLQKMVSRINLTDFNQKYNQGYTSGSHHNVTVTIDGETYFFSSVSTTGSLPFELQSLIFTIRKISTEIYSKLVK